jgi:hypothetical protein
MREKARISKQVYVYFPFECVSIRVYIIDPSNIQQQPGVIVAKIYYVGD